MSVIFGALALVAAALTFINIKYTCGKITEKNAIQEINRIKITNVVLALCMPYVLIFMFDVFMKRSDLSPAIIIFHVLAIYLSIISFIMNVVFSRRISRFCKAAKRYYSNLNLSHYSIIFLFPKYCIKIKIKAVVASIPSIIPAGSINIIKAIVTTQFITDNTKPHILFFHKPTAPIILTIP